MGPENGRYSKEMAEAEGDVVREIKEKADIDYEAANKIVDDAELARRIVELKEKAAESEASQLEDVRERLGASPEEESALSPEIQKLIREAEASITAGIDGPGHKSYSRGAEKPMPRGRIDAITGYLLKPSTDIDRSVQIRNLEMLGSNKPGSSHEAIIFVQEDPSSENITLIYTASSSQWFDASGRGGQRITLTLEIPQSEIGQISKMVAERPSVIRELAERAVRENIGIDQETWERGSARTGNNGPLRPPYESWDQEAGESTPKIYISSMVPSLGLPLSAEVPLK